MERRDITQKGELGEVRSQLGTGLVPWDTTRLKLVKPSGLKDLETLGRGTMKKGQVTHKKNQDP